MSLKHQPFNDGDLALDAVGAFHDVTFGKFKIVKRVRSHICLR
jgi:hypothetical protein